MKEYCSGECSPLYLYPHIVSIENAISGVKEHVRETAILYGVPDAFFL